MNQKSHINTGLQTPPGARAVYLYNILCVCIYDVYLYNILCKYTTDTIYICSRPIRR